MESRGGVGGRDSNFQPSAAGYDVGGGGGVGEGNSKRKNPEDAVVVAKQRALEIASRFVNDFESKRPRIDSISPSSVSSSSFTTTHPSSYQAPQFPVSYAAQSSHLSAPQATTKKILIPNSKVGVIIGRGGDQIKNLQLKSGARVQITRDADADPTSLTRDVELMGTPDQISRAEELINEVIADTDVANSASSGNRAPSAPQPGTEQFVMKVPNDKVALIIGKGGETIKSMQLKSGARIQVVPLHPSPNDISTERSIYINGTPEQIDLAKLLIHEVTSGNRMRSSSGSTGYAHSGYPPNAGWAPQGQHAIQQQQQPSYGYTQQGAYPMPPPYYGTYPPQQAGWDQTNPSAVPAPQQNVGYNIYGQQGQPATSATNVNYNYSQSPTAAGYSYNQGYTQQPTTYGQEFSGQAPAYDQQKAHANPSYGTSVTSQPDSSNSVQTSQTGYGLPSAVSTQADGTIQTVASAPAYATSYNQSTAAAVAPANGYGGYPSYAAQPLAQVSYDQSGYAAQPGYGQQQGVQAPSQTPQSYYGQSGYILPQGPSSQPNYYQGAYGPVPVQQPQSQSVSGSGVPQSSSAYGAEKADDGNSANGAVSDNP